ncbi:MAG: 2-hydroxyglutaryl-CoA dehydratase [Chloroflexi bacterium]|nr:2-hydroxyglutaryl-CoA dehydratase [Chloroflexota bacterium]
MTKPCFLGVDIGSLTVKAVLLDAGQRLLTRGVVPAGYGGQEAAEALVARLLRECGLTPDEIAYTVVTGYGRVRFATADEEVSEISCHARGAFHLCPAVRTVIDIGGQDSKAMRLDAQGRVVDFAMNDKCAAGTGRFLEVMAAALDVPIEQFGALALQSEHPVAISSTCTVFAESEAISHIARGVAKQDVAAGLHQAIASRVLGLAARVGLEAEVMLTGGVALNVGVVAALSRQSNQRITVPADPQTVGALGAALYAWHKGRR